MNSLFHVGTYAKDFALSFDFDINIPRPVELHFQTYDELCDYVDSQEFKEILDLPTEEGSGQTLRDVLSTYEAEMQVNNAVIGQAEADADKSGYDTTNLYTLQVDENGKTELVTTDITSLDASTQNELADRINQTPDRTGYDGYLIAVSYTHLTLPTSDLV